MFTIEPKVRGPLLAVLVCIGCCRLAGAEMYTLDTYYPSPVGVYNNISVTSTTALATKGGYVVVGAPNSSNNSMFKVAGSASVDFIQMEAYNNATINDASLNPGEDVPAPGRVLYNTDTDLLYYSSNKAVASDKTTWLKPISGFDMAVVAEGTTPRKNIQYWNGVFIKFPLYGDLNPWIATIGTGGSIFLKTKTENAGLYIVSATVNYCAKFEIKDEDNKQVLMTLFSGGLFDAKQIASFNNDVAIAAGACQPLSMDGMLFLSKRGVASLRVQIKGVNNGDTTAGQMTVSRVLSF